ncbi:uncharacterized protein [Atheta coriaria]|uniref:uncharacterized protein isoform X2 n=1 Tax=Dalotia coriaria TaxID=877792 RepID=UPI0031F342DD
MASRLWNQITSIKYLKHGTLRTYSSVKRQSFGFRTSHESGIRNLSGSKDLSSNIQSTPQGRRFVRNAPGPMKPSEAALRPSLRYRIAHGAKLVSKNAQNAFNTTRASAEYFLRDGSETVPDEQHIASLKREYVRRQTLARFQPQAMTPFCSKETQSYEREDVHPTRFAVNKIPRRHMSTTADNISIAPQEITITKKASDTVSVHSETPSTSESTGSAGSAGSVGSTSSADTTAAPNQKLSDKIMAAGPPKAHVGYNFTQLTSVRPFSTFSRPVDEQGPTTLTQTRGLIRKSCDDDDCRPNKCAPKIKLTHKDCSKRKIKKRYTDKDTYKHHGRWDKCECCPEMLPCDQTTCTYVYPFPCPCDKFPGMCPIDCPPPCENPPPYKVPLCRPPKCPVYQKHVECTAGCNPKSCIYVEPKQLRPLPKSDCPCVEPFVPQIMPKLKFVKKHAYQCLEEKCPVFCTERVDGVVPPKKLPPIIPGDCPCVERNITDVPPLRRLNMQAYQKVKECKPDKCTEIEQPKCIERRTLPEIKSDCVCIEPKPLKPVKLVRLPPICVCPDPPDPKCYPEKCPLRADEVCKWKYPKQKLKNFWCPNCKIPKNKCKWCNCHSRGQKSCHKRRMSTMASMKGQILASNQQSSTVENTASCSLSGSLGQRRGFHATVTVARHKKHPSEKLAKKLKCKKKKCPKVCGAVCCEPPARKDCKFHLEPLCCKVKRSPYPAFSEYGEFSELLTCECSHTMPYLQPNMQVVVDTLGKQIQKQPLPKWKIVDPVPEEHCVLNDLCRSKGHTYTCETFHKGETVPITQYECYSPHRLPCCERDQICDFKFRPSERRCDGIKKEREFYRCECACPRPKKCKKSKRYKLDTVYSKIRKRTNTRGYSTMSSVQGGSFLNRDASALPSTSTQVAGFHNTAVVMKRRKPRGGGHTKCRPQCPFKCKRKIKCGRPMCKEKFPMYARRKKGPKMDAAISRKLKDHFKRTIECSSARGRKRMLVAQAKCAARRIGMKLVPDRKRVCKLKSRCNLDGIKADGKCGPMPECVRPKNVCCACDPRYEVDECRKKKWVADCCEMPYRMTGPEFRSMQPDCCKMPLPICNRDCMRVRATCDKEYIPCCVIESPFPAFSDCHPPFKRIIHNECQIQDIMAEKSAVKIDNMLAGSALRRKFCTATKAATMPVIAEEREVSAKNESILDKVISLFNEKTQSKGLHEPVDCKCSKCVSKKEASVREIKPDLSRNIQTALPRNNGDIDNIPELLFSKDDIFKQVNSENLISLAPQAMTPLEKMDLSIS